MNEKSLDDQIIEAFFCVSKAMKGHMAFESKAIHLTMGQLHTLISVKKDKAVYMHDIASHFSVSMPTATSLINKLIPIN